MPKREVDKGEKLSLSQHKHCPVCGKAMEVSADFCSKECEQRVASRRKAQRRSTWIMVGIIGIVMLLFWVLMPLLFLGGSPGGR